MKILSAVVENFGSFERLEYAYSGQGLTLVSGPTGSGKSTLCDVVSWVLFGRTAKDGAVDEVRRWNASAATRGTVKLDMGQHLLEVTRIRGKGANDLFYNAYTRDAEDYASETGGYILPNTRGKDLNDTQKALEDHLGFTCQAYLAGAYYHEFSETAQFFTANAKSRRVITENLVDLSLAKTLTENLTKYKKQIKDERQNLTQDLAIKDNAIKHLTAALTTAKKSLTTWDMGQVKTIDDLKMQSVMFDAQKQQSVTLLEHKSKKFEADRKNVMEALEAQLKEAEQKIIAPGEFDKSKMTLKLQINSLEPEKCNHCGNLLSGDKKANLMARLHVIEKDELKNKELINEASRLIKEKNRARLSINPHIDFIAAEQARTNTFIDQLVEAKRAKNPYTMQVVDSGNALHRAQQERKDGQADLDVLAVEQDDTELMLKVIGDFRATLVKNTVVELETNTNNLLTKHFDAEIRVKFEIQDADKLEVVIAKDGNQCVYTQLSKGQRCLLKLCFGVSVMKSVANHLGVKFETTFFDEALDGLDETLKVKAHGLFTELSKDYDSILVVEHNETLKSLFTNQVSVALMDGRSVLEP